MSSENWLLLKSPNEALRARNYLEPTDGFIGIEGKWVCWLEWRGVCRLEIGVNAWSSTSSIHDFVRREVARRFGVRRIGHSCVGWYLDSAFEQKEERSAGTRYPGYTSWVAWAKDYKVEWSPNLPILRYYPKDYPRADFDAEYKIRMDELIEVEEYVVGVFKTLDAPRDIVVNGGASG